MNSTSRRKYHCCFRMHCLSLVKGVCLLCILIGLHPERGSSAQSDVSYIQRMARDMPEMDGMWCQPTQVHLSYGNSTTEMNIMWRTKGPCVTAVHYAARPWNLNQEAVGKHTQLDQSLNSTFPFIHRVVLKELVPSTMYFFRPQTKAGSASGPFYFTAPAAGNESLSASFLVLSNMERQMIESVTREAQSGKYSAILYGGDLEDILLSGVEQRDGEFLSDLEQAAGFVPLMTVPGKKVVTTNHLDGLYLYRNIFSMPGTDWPMSGNQLWYSFDVGQIHFLVYSTDVLFEPDNKNAKAQQDWVVRDLKAANKRRSETPWIIAMGSQPMYCSFSVLDVDDCAQNTSKVRHGFEDIFYIFAVDLVIESRHSVYERTWPQYKGVMITESYVNPKAPIEVIIGSSVGVQNVAEASDGNGTGPVTADWSAFHLARPATNGFGLLTVDNSSHLHWEWNSPADHSTMDSFWIIQDSHGDFNLAKLPHNISHQINQTIIAMGGKPGTYDFISGSTGSISDVEDWSEYSLWLGLAVVGAILVIIVGMVAVRSCMRQRRRARAGRRWKEVDRDNAAGGNFYSVASESDTDDNDFEIDVYDKTNKQSSKLLTSY